MTARIAIILPVHRHSVLVDDAIASALALEQGQSTKLIIINDGCPLAETRDTLAGWAARAPGRVQVLTHPNLGLSNARNTGIDAALSALPDCEAVFFLDADNRLEPHAATLWCNLLDTQPEPDWFYPQFDFFGLPANAHSGPDFSLALMSESNFCEAGSLVRRRLLDAGIRFDPAFRKGYEDWDFWLSAAGRGFTGAPIRDAFFRYRKRPESMLAGSHAGDAPLRAQIQAKHRWLFDRDTVATLLPAQTLLLNAEDLAACEFTDPACATPVSLDKALDRICNARARPAEMWHPASWAIARPGVPEHLGDQNLLHAAFWHLRQWTAQADVAALRLCRAPDGMIRIEAQAPGTRLQDKRRPNNRQTGREAMLEREAERSLRRAERDAIARADILMMSTGFLERHLFRPARRADGTTPGSTPFSRASVAALNFHLPDLPDRAQAAPQDAFARLDDIAQTRLSQALPPESLARWRADPQTVRPRDMEAVLRSRSHGGPVSYTHLTLPTTRRV